MLAIIFFAATLHVTEALEILAYATPVCATSHQLAIRRAAEALAKSGHAVTLLEPAAAKARRRRFGQQEQESAGNLTVHYIEGLISDESYSERFESGESYQRLTQEVNDQLLPQVLPLLSKRHFDVAVVDALYPVVAKELRLPSVHVQCASDPDALEGAWFTYGFGTREFSMALNRMTFVFKWMMSWLLAGSHQDYNSALVDASVRGRHLSWAEYYYDYVEALLLQGAPQCAVPMGGAAVAALHPQRVAFIGSLTDRPGVESAAEVADLEPASELALVAFGTHLDNKCPEELLRGLAEVGLVAVVLVEACRDVKDLPRHIFPKSRDQASWLRTPRMRLAVIHGGIHSLLEAVAAGIPVACVPGRGDQPANCRDLQRQRLGWGVHPKAPAEEAAAVFRMLLEGGHGNWRWQPQASALADLGGPRGLVLRVEQLAASGRLRRPSENRSQVEPMMPFFAAPLKWNEGWLISLAPLPLLILLAAECIRHWPTAKAKAS